MKKYTIIYAQLFQTGSHQQSITKMLHVECTPKNLKQEVEKTVDFGNVWFILDGHCNETED